MASKVSVIVPSFNHYDYLIERLDSIFNQSYQDYEVIIIDDLSTDSSIDILNKYKNHPRVKYFIINEVNSGSGYKSWYKGISLAESKYIWIAETDDFSDLNFLSETVQILENNEDVALVFTASNYIDKKGKLLYNTDFRMKSLKVKDDDFKIFDSKIFLRRLPIFTYITNGSAVVFRNPKQTIPDSIFSHKQLSDLFLWTYLVNCKKVAFINKKLNFFRRHEASTTTLYSSDNDGKIYKEFVSYINYYKCPRKIQYAVVKDYVYNYIMTKRNKRGFFYLTPISQMNNLSNVSLRWLYLKSFFSFFIMILKKKTNA